MARRPFTVVLVEGVLVAFVWTIVYVLDAAFAVFNRFRKKKDM